MYAQINFRGFKTEFHCTGKTFYTNSARKQNEYWRKNQTSTVWSKTSTSLTFVIPGCKLSLQVHHAEFLIVDQLMNE